VEGTEQRLAVVDLGSNSFRLVVFTAREGWWRRTDEIYEAVRIGEGLAATGRLGEDGMARAQATIEVFAHFCRASGLSAEQVDAVATSAIRDAANAREFLARVEPATGLRVRVLSKEEEARYGSLAAVNSTTLADGMMLDLGGGSMQLVRVEGRHARELDSWPLGAVRMSERFLPDDRPAKPKQLRQLRAYLAGALESAPWVTGAGERLVGIGGTVRNLGAAAQREAGIPEFGVQGYIIDREALDALVEKLAKLSPAERGRVPGIKPSRGDLILAGAVVVQSVMEAGGFLALEVTEAGLREGVFFERHLGAADPPLLDDVRRASVVNLAAQYGMDPGRTAHVGHVVTLSLGLFDELAAAGLHDGDPAERELLWASATLHDIGMAVDYDDHHKHSRYLVFNAGLPGFDQREVALIGQTVRYHRKGMPSLGPFAPLAVKGDAERLDRMSTLLRLAEDLERSRDQLVRAAHVAASDGAVRLRLDSAGDDRVARWAAGRENDLFERAFGRGLEVAPEPG
jgi:exopolyphosphatase / guanosine-5'-triphosphate,3'-diphosphate pyrophosphatase